MHMFKAYLIEEIVLTVPNTNKSVFFPVETLIRVNPDTGMAWIKQYQVELEKRQYSLIH